ncbi:hypothetical protein Taro_020695 [Colocasia esculenta]|uniref:Uncharacterized protein n=1 Tax=Colocasia esculenta TaxID=4460 RepID=A0A843UX12_COLES|nr:hypothetical protein [Colocasia esculenta]
MPQKGGAWRERRETGSRLTRPVSSGGGPAIWGPGKGAGGSVRLLIMDWWEKVVFPVKRAWVAVSSRVKTTPTSKSGRGILKLHEDVQTCEYQDVQVMWEMLRTEMEEELSAAASSHHPAAAAAAKRKRPPLSGVFVWSDRQHTRHHR